MKKEHKEILRASGVISRAFNCRAVALVVSKSHLRLILEHIPTGRRRFVVCGKTPSDHRSMRNHLANVKRESRGLAHV